MSSSDVKAAIRRPTVQQRLLLIMLTLGLSLGLLAMHILSGHQAHDDETGITGQHSTTMQDSSITSPHDSPAISASECSGDCGPGHSMAGMICILALLFTGLLLATAKPAPNFTVAPDPGLARMPLVAFRVRHGPAPPDLTVLSISRT